MARVSGLILTLLLIVGAAGLLSAPAMAVDGAALERGEQIFNSNCAACHMGGGNVIRANRTLKISDLNNHVEAYSSSPLEALEHEIEDGLNAMPSYADKLSEEDIIAVATYVEQRAELGWSRR
ncbi:MAG: c-type cytochrome [Synechococcus sp.]|jgi:cytochrome c6|uniref:c-type cytochrome n=1 Tax=unclassified Synechococcus TaxID=2626047 RepID=UPI0017A21E2B|nr:MULTISPECIES: c-type cytochrome [unclassified Synechococcus]MBA4736141.1 c-type cytochrome [Synechococcus sp.]MCB4390049.1 c-type cytochrome [Synechococcus sp. MU1617]MDO6352044.1 c-type cytochrome [Synechococcus sp. YX-04-1]